MTTSKPKTSTKTSSKSSSANTSNKPKNTPSAANTAVKEKPVTSAGFSAANKSKERRRSEIEKKRQQAEQTQRYLVFGVLAVVLVVIVIGIVLASRPLDTTFPDNLGTQYADIPSGLTTTGPNGITYPAPMPYLGSPTAPVKLEEISSFSCPYCLQYHDDHFSSIVDEIKQGRVEYIYLPTTRTGDFDSVPGTQAAYCAAQQNQFWPMQDILFDWQHRYGGGAANTTRLEAAAQKLNLDMGKYDTCFNSKAAKDYVTTTSDYSNARGLVGTPSVFLWAANQQVQPPPGQDPTKTTPGSVAGLAIGELRGIIEDNALKLTYKYF